jgi:uncharacterized protein YqgC (DUF456 family)
MEVLWWTIIGVLFFLAYVGILFPAVPDLPLMLAGFAVYHFFIDHTHLGWFFWTSVILLTVFMYLLDFFAGGLAAKKYGGSKWAIPAATLGALVFSFLGPFGVIIGPFLAVFLVELLQRKPVEQSFKIALGTLVGFLGGVIVKLVVITLTLIWFLILVF